MNVQTTAALTARSMRRCARIGAALAALLAAPAFAQQQVPLTGNMLGGRETSATATYTPQTSIRPNLKPSSGTAPPQTASYAPPAQGDDPPPARIGDTTRQILRMQAEGSRAGRPLPILGDEASASYKRYLKSFDHDIPEFFQTTVDKNSSGGTGSSGGN
jgi:hypothetical protein